MTTYPARGVVFITLSCLGWGEGTPTPSVGSCFLALSVVLININSFCLGALIWQCQGGGSLTRVNELSVYRINKYRMAK